MNQVFLIDFHSASEQMKRYFQQTIIMNSFIIYFLFAFLQNASQSTQLIKFFSRTESESNKNAKKSKTVFIRHLILATGTEIIISSAARIHFHVGPNGFCVCSGYGNCIFFLFLDAWIFGGLKLIRLSPFHHIALIIIALVHINACNRCLVVSQLNFKCNRFELIEKTLIDCVAIEGCGFRYCPFCFYFYRWKLI